jgi:hypothetical protein
MNWLWTCLAVTAIVLAAPHVTGIDAAESEARAPAVALVENGLPRAVLVLAKGAFEREATVERSRRKRETPEPDAQERLAGEELQEHLCRISGARLEIIPEATPLGNRLPVYIGSAADSALDAAIRKQGDDPGSFALVVGADQVAIRGLSPAGTLNGVYELLGQLGVRWFMPGELGMVTPQLTTVRIEQQTTIQAPAFPARHLQGVRAPEWERRMRLGGPYFPASHGIPGFGRRESERLFQVHPEYFSLIEGQRKPRQLCISNPAVLKIATGATKEYFRSRPETAIMGIGANDGRGFCECENCLALDGGDYDPFGHYPSMTDRYVWFFNHVLEGIQDEFPRKRLGFYAYSVYNRPPIKVKPNRQLVPAVALITLCRLHGMSNPVCPEKSYEKWIIREWGKLVPEVYYRGYWFNLADPGLPFFMIDRMRREIPLGKELGIAGWRVESPYDWAASVPSRYIACKLMWDPTADVDELMHDFYEKFFGPAAAPIEQYVGTMSRALTTADYHTGSSWDMPHIYSGSVRAEARAALDRAARLAPTSPYSERVRMYTRSLDCLDAFVEMLTSRAEHAFVTSKRALDRMATIRDQLLANDPPLIGRAAESYLHRFFAKATLEGYERTTGDNRLVAGLNDTWQFQIDPEGVGEAIGWWRPENTGGNWSPMATSTLSWSSQGLRYYKGLAWYRQAVEIPEEYRGKRVFLWVGGIDELAKVWVNGQVLGISPKGSFTPFEMDATEAIRPGELNTVVVCVSNTTLNELGTGGITGPAMFYAPAAGKDAQVRNAKPAHPVFPEY